MALQDMWQQHDWQHSPFAPRLHIVQALMQGGKTASGAGFSRYEALMRCLGETAEIAAMQSHETSEGLAAGPDAGFASFKALTERLERWALWRWWHGQLAARLMAPPPRLATLRQNALRQRRSSVWALPDFQPLKVAIAKSTNEEGRAPILGFGAGLCWQSATDSALIELGLMELNLITQPMGLPEYFSRIEAATSQKFQKGALFVPPPTAAPADKLATLIATLKQAGISFSLQPYALRGAELSVMRAVMPEAPSWAAPDDSPLL